MLFSGGSQWTYMVSCVLFENLKQGARKETKRILQPGSFCSAWLKTCVGFSGTESVVLLEYGTSQGLSAALSGTSAGYDSGISLEQTESESQGNGRTKPCDVLCYVCSTPVSQRCLMPYPSLSHTHRGFQLVRRLHEVHNICLRVLVHNSMRQDYQSCSATSSRAPAAQACQSFF